jgi:cytidylate kinase
MNDHDRSLSLAEVLVRSHVQTPGRQVTPEGGQVPPPPFTIAISREAGALGSGVAAEVGRRLGWPVHDRNILDRIARELHRPPSRLEPVDERAASWLGESLASLFDKYYVGTDAYLKHLFAAVRGLGEAGRCVIVGRGANFILPAETTLRVRLVALPGDRAQVAAGRLGLSAAEAAAWVKTTERERAAFIKRTFQQDVTDPHNYDLVLNLSRLTVDEAADGILETLRRLERRGAPAEGNQGPAAGSVERPASPALA